MDDKRIKVLYIAVWGRSGSTLLDNLLGQIDGVFATGELVAVWQVGFIENHTCGCGIPFRECPVWKQIIQEAFGGFENIDPARMSRLVRHETRSIQMPRFFLRYMNPAALRHRLDFLEPINSLYRAMLTAKGSRVIVDSSKTPSSAALLGLIPEIDLHIVHLVRDPKAVAYSWSIGKPRPEEYMRKMNPIKSSLLWDAWNGWADLLGRQFPNSYLRIRYEDFILSPQETIRGIPALIHEEDPRLPFLSEHAVHLNPTHTARGNPSRFTTGEVELIPDERWKQGMNPLTKGLVDLLTLPLLLKYGYRL